MNCKRCGRDLAGVPVQGGHRLLAGSATDTTAVTRLLGGAKPALCLTDPPYGISVVKMDSGSSKGVVGGGGPLGFKDRKGTVEYDNIVQAKKYYPIHGDDKPFDPTHLLTIGKEQVIFGANFFASKMPDGKAWVVWDKDASGTFSPCELAWTSREGRLYMYKHMWAGLRREGVRSEELAERVHPTQKPGGLLRQILEDFSAGGDVVVDPYLGSGSTLIACEVLGRSLYGSEIEPMYVDVAVLRWQQYSGRSAVLSGDGRTFEEVKSERCAIAA